MSQGFIYILENHAYRENILKIGQTTRSPQIRAEELFSTGVPGKFIIFYQENVPDCKLAEKRIHEKLSKYRYDERREFFVLPLQEAIFKVQEVTQREYYQNINSSHVHLFKEGMTMRWFCYDQDFIFIARYENPFLSQEPNIIDLWNCAYCDQFLITNQPYNLPSKEADDKQIQGYLIDATEIQHFASK